MWNLRLLFLVGLTTGFISENLFVSSQTTSVTDDLYLEGRSSGDLPVDDEDDDDDDDNDNGGSGSGDYTFSNFTGEELLQRFLNFSQTRVSKEMVPTAASPLNPSTTAATRGKDAETTPFIMPNGDNRDKEVAGPTAEFTQSPSSTTMPTSKTTETIIGTYITVLDHTEEDNSLDRWDVATPQNHGDDVQVENDILPKNGKGSRMYEMDAPEEVTSENMWERTEVLAAVTACGVVGFLCAFFLLLLFAYRMKKKDEGSYDLGDTKVSTTAYQKAPTKEFYA